MSGFAWHARIVCGNEIGAGFLVSARHVLTCAHVVRAADAGTVTVSFPGGRGLGQVSAGVAVHGGWAGGAADPGDLAARRHADEVGERPADVTADAVPGRHRRDARNRSVAS